MQNKEPFPKPTDAEQESGKGLDGTPCCALQCKDIPARPILEMLAKNPTQWHNWCWTEWNVTEAMPPGIPPKLGNTPEQFFGRTQRYPTETESASPILTQPTNNPKTQQQGGSPLG